MPKYIALLRGINVSGQKKIKMADLRVHLSDLELGDVQTYIQSGNITFKSPAAPEGHLAATIKGKILEAYGFEVPTLVVSSEELQHVAVGNPFPQAAAADPARMLVTFLETVPEVEAAKAFTRLSFPDEHFELKGKAVYLHCPKGYGRAKLNNNFVERKLKVPATTRNWKTILKLLEMTGQAQP